MSRPWMPFFPADYLGDTAHLTTAQHGAYLLLILHYWQHGGLPDDDCQLASLTKMTAAEWRKAKPVLAALFHDGWRHERIDFELADAEEKYEKRAAAGREGGIKSGRKRRSIASPAAKQCLSESEAKTNQPQPHTPNGVERERRAREAESLISEEAVSIANTINPDSIGLQYAAQTWLSEGIPRDFILSKAVPVAHKPLNYIAKTVRSSWAERQSEPLPEKGKNHGNSQSAAVAARDLREAGAIFGPRPGLVRVPPSGADVRLLSKGRREQPDDVCGGGGSGAV